jgi:hypothetical protein
MRKHLIILAKTGCQRATTPMFPVADLIEAYCEVLCKIMLQMLKLVPF